MTRAALTERGRDMRERAHADAGEAQEDGKSRETPRAENAGARRARVL